ncbi:MAG: DNA mismatch repair endonuclease MutL [Deltaproteobacteria bacterium]|nr:DNA mismatch repair endonuclease MutL [Deltaproteobacteria bacterium]
MSTRIQVLPTTLIDQIAAGEVVERPASVVKELVENSLDAGATRIICQVEEGGKGLVRVTDDGEGMGREDLALCVVRHATSKIRQFEDLQRIVSLGFRGEAMPSIAAVSRFSISTRRAEDEIGSRLMMEGGSSPVIEEVGVAVGTTVEVRDLFYNVPARQKFLRTPATEMGHISAWVTRLGLIRPDVHLRLEHNGRKMIDAPATKDLGQRTAALLGREVFEHLMPVEYAEEGLRIVGLLSEAAGARSNTRGIHIFVNGRYVRDRLLQYALMDGCRTMLPHGRFPVAVLHMEISPEELDVNVHPQKTEVRFADARRVQRALRLAVAGVMASSPFDGMDQDVQPARSYTLHSSGPRKSSVREALGSYMAKTTGSYLPKSGSLFVPPARAWPETQSGAEKIATDRPLRDLAIVAQLWRTYILLADQDRFVLMDQHAAHERITFERLRKNMEQGEVRSQRLLVPVQMEADAAMEAVVLEQRERLLSMGFEIEPFGERTLSVKALPSLLIQSPAVQLVRDVLDDLAESDRQASWEERRIDVLSRMACHSSVRAGKDMGEAEIRALLEQVEKIDFGTRCPHGRPVLRAFSRGEVENWFERS